MSTLIDGNGDIYVGNTLVATLTQDGIRVAKNTSDLMGLVTLTQLNTAASNGTPIGSVSAFAGSNAPAGWTICDGRALSRTDYADLFALIGTTFGAGNGTTTFNIPDLRGEFIRGWDAGRGADPGRVLGSRQKATIVGGYDDNGTNADAGVLENKPYWDYGADRVTLDMFPGTAVIYASGNSRQTYALTEGNLNNWYAATRPRNVALVFCIRSHFVSGGSSSGTPTQVVTPARSWKSVLASRSLGGVYSNPTESEIKVSVSITSNAASTAGTRPRFAVFIDTERIIVQQVGDLNGSNYADATENISFEVPAGATYSVKYLDGTNTLQLVEWSELRSWT